MNKHKWGLFFILLPITAVFIVLLITAVWLVWIAPGGGLLVGLLGGAVLSMATGFYLIYKE